MSPTTLSGRLFQTRTAVWIKVRPVEMVLETGTVRAWQGMDKLERVALLAKNGFGSDVFRSGGPKLVRML